MGFPGMVVKEISQYNCFKKEDVVSMCLSVITFVVDIPEKSLGGCLVNLQLPRNLRRQYTRDRMNQTQ